MRVIDRFCVLVTAGDGRGMITVVFNRFRGWEVSSALRGCSAAEKPVWAKTGLFLQVPEKRLKDASFGVILTFLGDLGI